MVGAHPPHASIVSFGLLVLILKRAKDKGCCDSCASVGFVACSWGAYEVEGMASASEAEEALFTVRGIGPRTIV